LILRGRDLRIALMFDIGTALGVVLLTWGVWLAWGAAIALAVAGAAVWTTAVASTLIARLSR
jgi:hypothetical protein